MLALSTLYLGLNYLWASYNSLILPAQVAQVFPNKEQDIALGLVAALGVGAGLVANLLVGSLSDKVSLPWGRRTPFILSGAILTAILLIVEARRSLDATYVVGAYVCMQIFSNMTQGAFRPLLPDLIPKDQRGRAAGMLGLFTMLGVSLGYGLTGYELGCIHPEYALLLAAILLLLTSLPTLVALRGNDLAPPKRCSVVEALMDSFKPSETAPTFFPFVAGTLLVYTGSAGLIYFEPYYMKAVLEVPNPDYGIALGGITVLLSAAFSAVVLGVLSDKLGRKQILLSAAIAGGVFMVALSLNRSFPLFLLLAALLGAVVGIFMSVRNAAASDLVPPSATGKYMAYANLAVGIPSLAGPAVDGLVLCAFGGGAMGFRILFLFSGSLYFLGAVLLSRVRGVRGRTDDAGTVFEVKLPPRCPLGPRLDAFLHRNCFGRVRRPRAVEAADSHLVQERLT